LFLSTNCAAWVNCVVEAIVDIDRFDIDFTVGIECAEDDELYVYYVTSLTVDIRNERRFFMRRCFSIELRLPLLFRHWHSDRSWRCL